MCNSGPANEIGNENILGFETPGDDGLKFLQCVRSCFSLLCMQFFFIVPISAIAVTFCLMDEVNR